MKKLLNPILQTAVQNHLDWKERIKDYFLGLNTNEPEFVDHTQCKLGKWLHNENSENLKDLEVFKSLVEVHRNMHETVPSIIDAKKSRNIKLYESEFRTFSTLTELVITKLELLDMEMQKLDYKESMFLARRFQNGICNDNSNLKEVFKFSGKIDKPVNYLSGDMLWSASKDNCHFMVLIDAVGHGPAA